MTLLSKVRDRKLVSLTPPQEGEVSFDLSLGSIFRSTFFQKCSQHQSRSSQMYSDTSLTSFATSLTTLFMIMIGFEHFFVFCVKFGLVFISRDPPPPTQGGARRPTYGHEPKSPSCTYVSLEIVHLLFTML